MTDRELLGLAAKAAGYEVLDWYGERYTTTDGDRLFPWNPLADDGDALRLAVKLGLSMSTGGGNTVAHLYGWPLRSRFEGPHDGDPDAATRRAIVRAAAEIGRAMP